MTDFVFMLTQHDRTVSDCIAIADVACAVGVSHIGFKDVGVDRTTLDRLIARLRASDVTVYMEVVSTGADDCLSAARTACELGVDVLLGGTDAPAMNAIIAESSVRFLPFPGVPVGHPTRLGGSPSRIQTDCKRFEAQGCAGVDLLAYRATEADPLALIRAARSATRGTLLVAGSIDSPDRIRAVKDAGADAFTIGSAMMDASFEPGAASMAERLEVALSVAITDSAASA